MWRMFKCTAHEVLVVCFHLLTLDRTNDMIWFVVRPQGYFVDMYLDYFVLEID